GASTTSTPLRRASAASRDARRSTSASSQVAARAVGQGSRTEGSRSSQVTPRTPAGPSESTILRSPMAGSAYVLQRSSPVTRRTFCSSVSEATSWSSRASRSESMVVVTWLPLVSVDGRRAQPGNVRQQALGVLVLWVPEHAVGLSLLDQVSLAHDQEPVADVGGLAEVVGDEEHAHP